MCGAVIRYKALHKPHHKWKNPTPFASHAFHPVDGWAQGLAYHIYVVFFPMHKVVHLVALILVNIWTTSIHDGVSFFPWWWLNGAAHHTIHHTDFNYNYGQYVIFWDWFFGSYRDPREQVRSRKEGLLCNGAVWASVSTIVDGCARAGSCAASGHAEGHPC